MKKVYYVGGAFLTLLLLYTLSYMIWLYTPVEYTGPEIRTISDWSRAVKETFDVEQDLCGFGQEFDEFVNATDVYYINCANQQAFRKARGIAVSANRAFPEPYKVKANLVKYSRQNLEDMCRKLRVNFDRSFHPVLRDAFVHLQRCKIFVYADRITPKFRREVEKIIPSDAVQYYQYYPPQIAIGRTTT